MRRERKAVKDMKDGFQTFGRLAMAFILISLSSVAHGGATMRARPFVKWAGGKGQLLGQLDALLPNDFAQREDLVYVEPFVGGAAMLFHVLAKYPNVKRAIINDANSELVSTYKTIKTNPEELIGLLSRLQEEFGKCATEELRQDMYNKLRDKFNAHKGDELETSALFIFLNKTCFNGLYRVNSKGEFNVPFGKAKNPTICDADNIRALNKVKGGFNDDEQRRLAQFCRKLDRAGHQWMLSNSDPHNVDPEDDFFEELYQGFDIKRVVASRAINSKGDGRGKIAELAIRNYGE